MVRLLLPLLLLILVVLFGLLTTTATAAADHQIMQGNIAAKMDTAKMAHDLLCTFIADCMPDIRASCVGGAETCRVVEIA